MVADDEVDAERAGIINFFDCFYPAIQRYNKSNPIQMGIIDPFVGYSITLGIAVRNIKINALIELFNEGIN